MDVGRLRFGCELIPRQVVGPRVLPDPIHREVPRPSSTRHPPTCKHGQTIVQHWDQPSEVQVAISANYQRFGLDWLLDPLSVPSRPLPYPSRLPHHFYRAYPFLWARATGLRVCQDRSANLAIPFVVPLHWVGRLRGPTRRGGY